MYVGERGLNVDNPNDLAEPSLDLTRPLSNRSPLLKIPSSRYFSSTDAWHLCLGSGSAFFVIFFTFLFCFHLVCIYVSLK